MLVLEFHGNDLRLPVSRREDGKIFVSLFHSPKVCWGNQDFNGHTSRAKISYFTKLLASIGRESVIVKGDSSKGVQQLPQSRWYQTVFQDTRKRVALARSLRAADEGRPRRVHVQKDPRIVFRGAKKVRCYLFWNMLAALCCYRFA